MKNFWKQCRLELTGQCNLRCDYCFASKKNTKCFKKKELSFKEWLSVIEQIKGIGIKEVDLIGGEPLMHPQIWEIIEALKGTEVAITTNALLINNQFIQKIIKNPHVKEVRISLDGLKKHDLIRKGSSYKQVLTAAKRVKKETESTLIIQTTLNQENLSEILSLYSILKKIPVDRWKIGLMQLIGPRPKKNAQKLEFESFDELSLVMQKIIKKYIQENPPFRIEADVFYETGITKGKSPQTSLQNHPCEYHMGRLCVQANGDIVFCSMLPNIFGNIKKSKNLKKAADSQKMFRWEYLELNDMSCSNCKYVNLCTGGCRAHAQSLLGDILAPDPLACSLIPRFYKYIVPILPPEEQKFFNNLIREKGEEPTAFGDNIKKAIKNYQKNRFLS
jgi:radical SAM protein with 4Fe4S-binding SPASM domain